MKLAHDQSADYTALHRKICDKRGLHVLRVRRALRRPYVSHGIRPLAANSASRGVQSFNAKPIPAICATPITESRFDMPAPRPADNDLDFMTAI
jgi:hypothetical protein